MKAHKKFGKEFRKKIEDRTNKAIATYFTRKALLDTYDELGIENEDVTRIREQVAKEKKLLQNRGVL